MKLKRGDFGMIMKRLVDNEARSRAAMKPRIVTMRAASFT